MYRKILVPLDGSATATAGLREAIGLAATVKARLILLNVVLDVPVLEELSAAIVPQEVHSKLSQLGRDVLAKAKREALSRQVEAETLLHDTANGAVAEAILAEVARQGCDLIVMGTHGRRGFRRLTLGSDAEMVVRHSPVPVLLVRHEDKPAT
jgi:nucleotide-binding universal stress UspA family protein